ncbi:MAG: response regulator [Deltaproteobacteria bacterium]|nr:response regulator [Deltaproteobacteria bacterium]
MPKNIMIIDDEEDIRTYLMAVLEDNGFQTCTPAQEENVMDALQREQPDLVLLDIMMPQRSGISIFRDLRNTAEIEHVPVALISGIEKATGFFDGEIMPLLEGTDLTPPDGFIEKPIRIGQLLAVVEKILETKGEKGEFSD